MLTGLVPLRGAAIDYVVATYAGQDWIVHRAVLDVVEDRPSQVRPLHLVGVAEQALFWKDIRRLLFAGTPYRVLARLARDGVHDSWTPVKLVDVLRRDFPDIAGMIDAATDGALPLVQAATQASAEPRPSRVREVLVAYAAALAAEVEITVSEDELETAGLLDVDGDPPKTVTGWRDVCEPITRFVAAATARTDAKIAAGVPLIGAAPSDSTVAVPSQAPADEQMIDAEIVAIYW